jgi:predicted short-subunit dehydrogenase-like oxidoreductase (DUF2520 family)
MAQLPSVTILGAGRIGQGLALTLRGRDVCLVSRQGHPVAAPLRLYPGTRAEAVAKGALLILAVPDDAVTAVAADLAAEGSVGADHTVLHLSGLLDREALAPLVRTGAALGSFHPLQTIADPASAPQRLAGAYAGLEGDHRAIEVGEQLAQALRMLPVRLPADGKAAYHAGAAMVANYTVALFGVAERLAVEAGVPPETAARLYLPLLRGTAANLESGPVTALTGPLRRGDVRTIRAHLAVLSGADARLYRVLGLEALRLARQAGLPPELADRVAEALRERGE